MSFLTYYALTESKQENLETVIESIHKRTTELSARKDITSARFRKEFLPLAVTMWEVLHQLHESPSFTFFFQKAANFDKVRDQLRQIAQLLHTHKCDDLDRCPHCRRDNDDDNNEPDGPIDRPPIPESPLEITPGSLAKFMQALRGWLLDAAEELFEQPPAAFVRLPPAPDRYLIGDLSQIEAIVSVFTMLQRDREDWAALLRTKGLTWDSEQTGLSRWALLDRVRHHYGTLANPPETTGISGFKFLSFGNHT